MYAETIHGGSPSIGFEPQDPVDNSRSPDLVDGRVLLPLDPFLAFGLTLPRASGGMTFEGAEGLRGTVAAAVAGFLGDTSVAARFAGCALRLAAEGSKLFKAVLFDLGRVLADSIGFPCSSGLFSRDWDADTGSVTFLGTGILEPVSGLAGMSPSPSSVPFKAAAVSGVLGSRACDEFFLLLECASGPILLVLLWLLSLRGLLRERGCGRIMPAA